MLYIKPNEHAIKSISCENVKVGQWTVAYHISIFLKQKMKSIKAPQKGQKRFSDRKR